MTCAMNNIKTLNWLSIYHFQLNARNIRILKPLQQYCFCHFKRECTQNKTELNCSEMFPRNWNLKQFNM